MTQDVVATDKTVRNASCPAILFGAFDRHNFGDLLLPHVATRLMPDRDLRYGGLAERNLVAQGGHHVHALARLAAGLGDSAVDIIHVGGEILTCNAWEAAVMLLPPEPAREIVARLDARPQERTAWAQALLGLKDDAPYVLPAEVFANVRRVTCHAIGGIDLDRLAPAMRAEVLAKLKSAARVGVRDKQTLSMLEAGGVACHLEPDPAVMVAELFGDRIRQRARHGELARVLSGHPRGYLAVQFSAEFGDDHSLAQLALQLERVARSRHLGIVLFRAGAAPWHDDLACYRRLAAQLRHVPVTLFASLNLWDICALIAHSRGYAGSSLHGSIVASAFALPRLGLLRPGQAPSASKQVAYWATWGSAGAPAAVPVQELSAGVDEAMSTEPSHRQSLAETLVKACRACFVTDRTG